MPLTADKRVVVVTGASRGLGREIALRFGSMGERIVVNYLSSEMPATDVVGEISRSGGDAVAVRADVRLSSAVDAMMNDTVNRWGKVDVIVNNAGITNDGLMLRMNEQAWDDVVETNLTGAFHVTRAASKIMSTRDGGHIINIASIIGAHGREG
ncbi:MAG TPA: SDR family NAD(P)-dependent oxidoreductase, partial [Nitrospirota bacterium]